MPLVGRPIDPGERAKAWREQLQLEQAEAIDWSAVKPKKILKDQLQLLRGQEVRLDLVELGFLREQLQLVQGYLLERSGQIEPSQAESSRIKPR
jgi:hypothetical protein